MFNPYMMSPPETLLRVSGIEGARTFPLRPGSQVALFDSNKDVFYLKSTDAGGYATITAFEFHKLDDAPSDYITRDEFEELREEIRNVRTKRKPTVVVESD